MNVKLLTPYGFCFGVDHVMKLVDKVVLKHPKSNIYCVGQLVHNKKAVDSIIDKGIIIKTGDKSKIIDSITSGVIIFSAHGTDKQVIQKAINKGLIVYNAVCPFVESEMNSISSLIKKGFKVIFIGVKNHDEANAVLSLSDEIIFITDENEVSKINLPIDAKNIMVVTQTTMSIDDVEKINNKLKEKYRYINFASEMCESTRVRQTNLKKELSLKIYDGVIVVGDENSNNGKSLYKIAKANVEHTIMLSSEKDLNCEWLKGLNNILITSSASTSKENVEKIYKIVKNL